MTCTQRNSLVFMTSTFILFLQVQIYPAALNSFHQENHKQNPNDYHQNYHRHPHHHHHHHHHRHHHRHDHHNISNQSNHTVDQYNHLRHSSYRHHNIPVRNQEQVQQHHLHNFQHKITSIINSTPTYSWRSADKIQHPLPSSPPFYSHERYNTTRHKIQYWKNSSSSTLGSNNYDRNRNDGGVDYNGGRFFFISDNNHQNTTLKSHQHSSNNNSSNNNHQRRKTFNRNTLQPYNDNDSSTSTLIEDSYLTQSSKSKGRSNNVNRYGILDSKSIIQQTTKSKSKKIWQSSKKSNSWYLLRPHSKNNNENGLDNSESEDYYDDDQDDEFIDAEDNDENNDDNHDDDDDDDVIKNDRLIESNQFKLSNIEQKFTPITTMSTPKTIQKLHSDLSYDYLYDEPTNGSGTITDEKSGSLTEEKWRNYGTAEAVEKSRRRHLSEAQIIAAHITRINLEAMCKYPRPKIIQINEASKRYVPHCTVLHRCGDDTGCCHSETQTCVAKKTVTVDLHFYAIPLKTKDPIVEILSFVNHTECHCVDRYPIRSGSTAFLPSSDNNRNPKNLNYGNNNSDQKNHKNLTTCNCIRHFDIFEEDFDDDSDYQQQQSDTSSSSSSSSSITKTQSPICRCDCTSDNLTCQRLKRGQEGIPVDDRRCISEGRCVPPTCEYGIYIRSSGRCPRVMVKRTAYGTT